MIGSARHRWLAISGCAVVGCIIPDSKIDVQPQRTNPGSVRIVQAVALTPQADAACAEEPGFEVCPQPPDTVVPGLIELENQAFCTCEGGRDGNELGGFQIFVEDADVDDAGEPIDDLFGVLLLDVPPDTEQVSAFVAFTNYLPSNQPAQRVAGGGTYAQPIERPPTNVKEWALGVETKLDLCNDNNGSALEPGLHSLRLVVTDRPWPQPVLVNEFGRPQGSPPFERDAQADPLVGVPDLAAGASYATANFVFRCVDESSELGLTVCNCEEDEG